MCYSYSVLDVGWELHLQTFSRRRMKSDRNTKLTFHVFSWKTLNATWDERIFSCRRRAQAPRELQPKWNVEECVGAISSIGLAVLFQRSAPTAADWQLHLSSPLWSLMHMQPAALIKKKKKWHVLPQSQFLITEKFKFCRCQMLGFSGCFFPSFYTEQCRILTESHPKDAVVGSDWGAFLSCDALTKEI